MGERDNPLSCVVAIDFIKGVMAAHAASRQRDTLLVFSDEPDRFEMRATRDDRWHNASGAGEIEIPSLDLSAKFIAQGGASALRHCRSVRNFLTDQHIPYGPGAVKRARGSVAGPGISGPVFDAEIVGLTVPAVSEDGTQALLSSGSDSGVHMASGNYYYLRPDDDGIWRVRSVVMRWMS
jgi:hypothetical protein